MPIAPIQLHDLQFVPLLQSAEIKARVKELGQQIQIDFATTSPPILVGILKGAVVFLADLMQAIAPMQIEISFMQVSSYTNTSSSGQLDMLLHLKESITDRHVILVEDIIDSGRTIQHLMAELAKQKPASIQVAALLHKPDAVQYALPLRYIGFDIPNDFVVGYGLDYNGLGRNLPDVYVLAR